MKIKILSKKNKTKKPEINSYDSQNVATYLLKTTAHPDDENVCLCLCLLLDHRIYFVVGEHIYGFS